MKLNEVSMVAMKNYISHVAHDPHDHEQRDNGCNEIEMSMKCK